MPNSADWTENDQTPDNPYGKSEDYEGFLDYLGDLGRSLTPAIAANPLKINVYELNDHPEYKAAVIGALQQWATVTPLQFEIIDDRPFNGVSGPYDGVTDWIEVVSPEVGEEDDGSAYSANRYVSIGQRFHDTEPDKTDLGGYVFDSYIHEFGHEFGLNHPGLYNYSGPGGVQINYLNNGTWIYDRQQYSVMSYFDGIDVGETTRWSPTTPLPADIEAVIRRFFSTVDSAGVRTYQEIQLNTGNDSYGFGSSKYGYELTSEGQTHDIGFVIHDTGGNDTIDFSGSTSGTILDLRAGKFSSVNGHNNNVSIFAGHNADQTGYYIEKGIGSAFDDTIIGNDGNNTIDGGRGTDHMAGGAGDDVYYVDSEDDIVLELAGGGNDTVIVTNRNVDISSIENVEHIFVVPTRTTPPPRISNALPTSVPTDTPIDGDGQDNTIDGGANGDIIRGLGGDDILIGGRDTLASRDINNTIDIEDLEDQTETDDGDDWLYGGAGNDELYGGAGNDRLYGGAGNDTMYGQAGRDVFYGGAGVDTVDYSKESPFQLLVNLNLNIASGGTGSGDLFYSIENLIGSDDRIDRFIGTADDNYFQGLGGGDYFNGGDGDDVLDSGRDGDIVYGEGGNDTIIGGAGQDYLDGGAGVDTVVYRGSSAGVTIDLANGEARGGDGDGPVQIVGRGTLIKHDILVGFENATGSAFDDHIFGTNQRNVLSGGNGDDFLTGGGGKDLLEGGAGSDTADYSTSISGVVASLQRGGPTEGDTYRSIENLAGSGQNDRLTGNAAANVLTGQGGDDRLDGGNGDDVLNGDFADNSPPPPGPVLGTGYTTLGPDAANNSIATALDITENFSLASDADIFDSTTVPHTTVNATGNGQAGYYKLDLVAGSTLTIDIDHIADPDVFDSWIQLRSADGTVIADNDDGGSDPGSTNGRDSSLSFAVIETGTYYIAQGSWTGPSTWTAAVPVGETYELNVSVAPSEEPTPPGTAGLDVLNGGNGADLLDGGGKADVLTGGNGEDAFRFSTQLGSDNIDRITDFNVSQDTIQLDDLVMSALGAVGDLVAAAFHKSVAGVAHDATDRVIYDTNGGQLWYDADGNGAGAALQIARLSAGLNITASNFVVI